MEPLMIALLGAVCAAGGYSAGAVAEYHRNLRKNAKPKPDKIEPGDWVTSRIVGGVGLVVRYSGIDDDLLVRFRDKDIPDRWYAPVELQKLEGDHGLDQYKQEGLDA